MKNRKSKKLLLNSFVNLEEIDSNGNTMLLDAVLHADWRRCLHLLNLGANVDATSESGNTSMHLAVMKEEFEKILVLIAKLGYVDGLTSTDKKCNWAINMSPLEAAAVLGNDELLTEVLSNDIDIKTLPRRVDKAILSATIRSKYNSIAILKAWIDKLAISPEENIQNEKSKKLNLVIRYGNINEFNDLLNGGADLDFAMSPDYWTPLHLASYCNKVEMVRNLLERGANIECRDIRGSTPLSMSIERGHAESCLTLLDYGSNVDPKDSSGETPLLISVELGHFHLVDILLDRGADINCVSNSGYTRINQINECMRIKRMNLLIKAVKSDDGVLLTEVLDLDAHPQSLPGRAAKALQIANDHDKHESVAILSSWISRQAAMAALSDFAEPTIAHTSPHELAARSVG